MEKVVWNRHFSVLDRKLYLLGKCICPVFKCLVVFLCLFLNRILKNHYWSQVLIRETQQLWFERFLTTIFFKLSIYFKLCYGLVNYFNGGQSRSYKDQRLETHSYHQICGIAVLVSGGHIYVVRCSNYVHLSNHIEWHLCNFSLWFFHVFLHMKQILWYFAAVVLINAVKAG